MIRNPEDNSFIRTRDAKLVTNALQDASIHLVRINAVLKVREEEDHLANQELVRNVDLERLVNVVVLALVIDQSVVVVDLADVDLLQILGERARPSRRRLIGLGFQVDLRVGPAYLIEVIDALSCSKRQFLHVIQLLLAFLSLFHLRLRNLGRIVMQTGGLPDVVNFTLHHIVKLFHLK